MSSLKESILKLREEGKNYKQIKLLLDCSLSTISYYCSEGQKEKTYNRLIKRRSKSTLVRKLENFKNPPQKTKKLNEKVRDFQRRQGGLLKNSPDFVSFTIQDVLKKIGENPVCYLSGEKLNLEDPKSFVFDHIVPSSREGDNTFENLGLTSWKVNRMKYDMTIPELLEKCVQILEHNGYKVNKPK